MSSEQFRIAIDRDLENLIPEYILSIRSNIVRIQKMLEVNDMESIRTMGHNMKGSGGGYGFNKITDIGLLIEDGAKANDASAIRSGLKLLEHYLDNISIEFVEV